MQEKATSRIAGIAVAIAILACIVLKFLADYAFGAALVLAVLTGALAALLLWLLGEAEVQALPLGRPAAGAMPMPVAMPRAEPARVAATPPARMAARGGAVAARKPGKAARAGRGRVAEAPRKGRRAAAAPAPMPAADDLKRINGIGPKLEQALHGMGVTSFRQIADWTEADVARIDAALKFSGRIRREGWVEQARILAESATAGLAPGPQTGDGGTG